MRSLYCRMSSTRWGCSSKAVTPPHFFASNTDFPPGAAQASSISLHGSTVSQTERLFKAKYGVSPIRYALDKKLDAARVLFTTTFLNVGEVAERLSFANVKYFSRQFKLRFGQTPSECIRSQEKNPFADAETERGSS